VLEYVAHAEHDNRVADDENALAAMFTRDHLGRAAQAENDVAPAFSSGRAVIELAEQAAGLGLVGVDVLDSDGGEPVENAKLLLAKPLVDHERVGIFVDLGGLDDETGGMPRPQVRRSENDIGSILRRKPSEPVSKRSRLALPQFGQRYIDVADVEVDHRMAGLERCIARDIPRGLAVTDDVDQVRPDLGLFHAQNQVKERTRYEIVFQMTTRGANLVTMVAMKSTPDQHDPDWPRYPETVLDFATTPAVEIDLREIPPLDAIAALKAAGLGQPFAIMTAFDPRGENLSSAENEKRKQELDKRLRSSGYKFAQVTCCSPDRSHCECSVAVVMSQEKALDLAREMEQVAIFWFDGKRFWILGALAQTGPLMLPRS
jgi:hypothetical protein